MTFFQDGSCLNKAVLHSQLISLFETTPECFRVRVFERLLRCLIKEV